MELWILCENNFKFSEEFANIKNNLNHIFKFHDEKLAYSLYSVPFYWNICIENKTMEKTTKQKMPMMIVHSHLHSKPQRDK